MLPGPKPIYSVHDEDAALREPINDFVIGLAERVDRLQDLHSLADLSRLAELCGDLADEAGRLGYPLLASVATFASPCWSQCDAETFKLLPSDGHELLQFGCSVAISGTSAIVGAYWDNDLGTDSGSAYL